MNSIIADRTWQMQEKLKKSTKYRASDTKNDVKIVNNRENYEKYKFLHEAGGRLPDSCSCDKIKIL